MIAADTYWYHAGMDMRGWLEFLRSTTVTLLSVAESYGKRNQVWLQAFRVPRGREAELGEALRLASGLGVESVFASPHKGGEDSILKSDDPVAVWEAISKAHRGEDR